MPIMVGRLDRELGVMFDVPFYDDLVVPQGWLANDPACNALFHYALVARMSHENAVDTTAIEGTHDESPNYHILFKSIARQHGVDPVAMVRFWRNVDMQFTALHLPHTPAWCRFDKPIEIKTVRDET